MAKGRGQSKQYSILIRPKAAEDLDAIADYIAIDSPANAEEFIGKLVTAIDELKQMPERYAVAREAAAFGFTIRQRVVGRYRILYSVERAVVRVLRVRSAYQDRLSPDDDSLDE
jgi:toxin ParE1/3/4